jgi:FkbM family methyltransferase
MKMEIPRAPAHEILFPPSLAPLGRRVLLRTLRAAPVGQALGMRIYNRLTRMIRQHRRVRTYFGATIDCDLAELITMCIFHFGVWEPHISALIQSRVRPGDMFCDVGANIGYDTILAANLVGRCGRVVAIEASPSTFEKLLHNLRLNEATNVRAVQAAVTAVPGAVTLYRGLKRDSGRATTVASLGFEAECEVVGQPLTDILSQEERERLRFIKIDVEGAERPILSQLLDSIDLFPRELEILVEISAAASDSDGAAVSNEIFARFAGLGFQAYSVPNSYEIAETYLNFRGVELPTPIEFPSQQQQDVLFSRSYAGSRGC